MQLETVTYTYVFNTDALFAIEVLSSADAVAGTNAKKKSEIINAEATECKHLLFVILFPPGPFLICHYFRYFNFPES